MLSTFIYSIQETRKMLLVVKVLIRGCLLLYIFMLATTSALAQNPLIIGTSYKLLFSTPEQDGTLDNIAREAFARIGIPVELPFLPAERSLLAANSGIHDGELNRITNLEKNYPNLVRVEESMMTFRFVAFTKNCNVQIASWSAFIPYRVGIIKGWKILEDNTGKLPQVTYVNSAQQLFTQLDKGRIDIALYGELLGYAQLHAMGIDDFTVLQPPLAEREMYMYLHKKHKTLAPLVAGALRSMKEDGTYNRLFMKATNHLSR